MTAAPMPPPGQPPIGEQQDDKREEKEQGLAQRALNEHRGLAQRQLAMMHAVVQHRILATAEHGDDHYPQAKQEPALRVPGLAPGHQHPEQAAGQSERRGKPVFRGPQVAGEAGQQHPGGYQRKTESAEDHSRHRRCPPEATPRGLRRRNAGPARWPGPCHEAHATPGPFRERYGSQQVPKPPLGSAPGMARGGPCPPLQHQA